MKEKKLSVYAFLERDTINFYPIKDIPVFPLEDKQFHAEDQLADLFNQSPAFANPNYFQTLGVKRNKAQRKLIKFDQAPLCAEVKEKRSLCGSP